MVRDLVRRVAGGARADGGAKGRGARWAAGAWLAGAALLTAWSPATATAAGGGHGDDAPRRVFTRSIEINGVKVAYREAGADRRDEGEPVIVLLHGFPTSSHMFRELIPKLADEYRVIAPDYPGYGLSDAPSVDAFQYTFDNLSKVVDELLQKVGADEYVLYVQDYGAPVGYRIAVRHPERVRGLIVQNGNAYEEGLPDSFWGDIKKDWAAKTDATRDALRSVLTLEATKWQYFTGAREPDAISPDNWLVIQPLLDRPGNQEIQLALFRDYGSNPPLYPSWQAYFREHQPPTLITWGRHDPIFPAEGAWPYLRDLKHAELHLLDTGHFALEEDVDVISHLIRRFLAEKVVKND